MDQNLAVTLSGFAFSFMLVLCRTGAAIMLMPGFGEEDLPMMPRVGIAVGIAVLLTPVVAPDLPSLPDGFLRLAGMVAAELAVGALLGWLARLAVLALPIAGQIIALMTGLSSVLQPDPVLGAQSAPIGRLFGLLAPVVVLASGLYAMPLSALAGSYAVVPAVAVPPGADVLEIAVRAVAGCFTLALRLAAPFLVVSTIWQVSLGLVSRLVPQIQIFFASLPGQVLGGLLLLSLLGGAIVQTWKDSVQEAFAVLPGF